MPRFEWPWVLLLLAAVPWLVRRRPAAALAFNRIVPDLPLSRRVRWLRLPAYLRAAALSLTVLALAGPRLEGRRVRNVTSTIALQLALDCSGSMEARDMDYEGRARSRLEVVREVSQEFVARRPDDLIGLIAFGEDPVTLSPLTLDHELLRPMLRGLRIAQRADGTAIGDSLAVAAARIRQAEIAAGETFRGKAVILITDGENNSGARAPSDAARLARSWGVRVYAIGIRPGGGENANLEGIAKATGGIARMAASGDALRDVYREIDQLERSQQTVPNFRGGWAWIYALVGGALLLLATEMTLTQTWLRRIP
jgi:Ca-activated chloride channel homolog